MLVLAAATATPTPGPRLVAAAVALLLLATAASYAGSLRVGRDQVTAAVRAALQLGAVSLVIAAALASLGWSLAFVALMYAVATLTATGRIGVPRRRMGWLALAMAAGVLPVLAVVVGSGVVPFDGAGILPIAGIVIGNTMTACSLAGRRAFAEIRAQYGVYEAGLALGLRSREAAYLVLSPTAREGLNPGLDQTRTVGLVTLPGAYIGVLLGGGSALDAGAAQLLVLVGLLAAQALATAVVLRLVAAGRLVDASLVGRFPK